MSTPMTAPATFHEALQTQRWDDHRFSHHSWINQTLHLISTLSFLAAYVFPFVDLVVSPPWNGWSRW